MVAFRGLPTASLNVKKSLVRVGSLAGLIETLFNPLCRGFSIRIGTGSNPKPTSHLAGLIF